MPSKGLKCTFTFLARWAILANLHSLNIKGIENAVAIDLLPVSSVVRILTPDNITN
jgi:hypothetical protein